MVNQQIKESDLNKVKTWGRSVYLNDDLLLTEHINEAPISAEPCRMNFILIGLCTKGQVVYQLDTQQVVITPGDMLILSDRHVVGQYQQSPDMEGLCIMMSVRFYQEVIQNIRDVSSLFLLARSHPVMKMSDKEIKTFKEYFEVIKQKISDHDNRFRHDLVRALLLAMFYDLSNVIYRVQQNDEPRTRAEVIFTRFIRLVDEHYREERRVGWYAQQLCITPKYLSETVKQVSRRTPNEWIDSYITMELRVQLKNSTKSIKEITDELHFPNQSFLGKYFKEHVGMSPSKFRKSK